MEYTFRAVRIRFFFVVTGEHCDSHPMAESADAEPSDHLRGNIEYGSCSEAHPKVFEATGVKYNNIKLNLYGGFITVEGVLSDDKKKVTFYALQDLDSITWTSKRDFIAYKELISDPADAMSHHFKIQPEYQGKLLWISGPPGLGKSTTAQILGKMAEWVYYEADAFMSMVNPYIPLDVEDPSMAQMKQKPLKGLSKERIDIIKTAVGAWLSMSKGGKFDEKVLGMAYREICKDIKSERARLGGDWVIAQAVPTRQLRKLIKDELGSELFFVCLNMSSEEQVKRLERRHGNEEASHQLTEFCENVSKYYEPAGDDEVGAVNMLVTSDMSREHVARKVLGTVYGPAVTLTKVE